MWDTNAIAHQYILRKAKGEFLFQTETQPMYIKQLDSCWSCTNKAAVGAEASAPPSLPWTQLLCKAASAGALTCAVCSSIQVPPCRRAWAPARPETTLAVQKACVSALGTTAECKHRLCVSSCGLGFVWKLETCN